MKRIISSFLFFALSFALSAGSVAQNTVSLETLLEDMIDRDVIARYPRPSYICRQSSSYDRQSVEKDAPGWFANSDANNFIRVEENKGRTEFVMLDTEGLGPGAIVRFWMTFAGDVRGRGMLRFYLDGNDEPEIAGPAMDILSGGALVGAPLATSVSELTPYVDRGHDFYLPVPYARSCKITNEPLKVGTDGRGNKVPDGETVFYNINYRTYSPRTRVISFTMDGLERAGDLVDKVQRYLGSNYHDALDMKLSSLCLDAVLAPGGSRTFGISGSRAVRQLRLRLDAPDIEQALRSTVLEIVFDGERTVWVPVGDFMGIGYFPLHTDNWYTETHPDGSMDAFWVMPFRSGCSVTLHNFSGQQVCVTGEARYGRWRWDDRSMHFGSDWHQYTGIGTRVREGEPGNAGDHRDINFTVLKGKGVYAGDGISVFNTANMWWGEGDEKIYVDGESFPSHFGTGTEDYYGYAWCSPSVFTGHPFIAQPDGRGSFESALSVNTRFRSLDAIPFSTGLVSDIELWHWADCKVNYAPVTFWYMLPGGKSMVEEDIEGASAKVARRKSDITSDGLETLCFECENMNDITCTGGKVDYQNGAQWGNGCQLFWHGVSCGDRLEMTFRTGKGGFCDLTGVFTTANDYGTYDIYLNGEKIGDRICLNSPDLETRQIGFGTVELRIGVNSMAVEAVSVPEGMETAVFGLDRLVFEE